MAQNPTVSSGQPKPHKNTPKMTQNDPKSPPKSPKTTQDDPKSPQNEPKITPKSNSVTWATKNHQKSPKIHKNQQKYTKSLKNTPKIHKNAQKIPQNPVVSPGQPKTPKVTQK